MAPPPPPARARRLDVAAGPRLHALEWDGDGPALPFLLVHGLASNCRTWEAVGGLLAARGHPVVAVDQRGHGRSDAPDEGYDFATLTADLVAVLDGLGWDRAVVAGQSTGGNIAVELAGRAGDRLAGVAGVDGGAIDLASRWPDWDDCASALAPPALEGTPAADLVAHLRRAHPDWDDWGVEATLANLEVRPDGTVRPRLRRDRHLRILRALWEHRPAEALPAARAPVVLVLAGQGDARSAEQRAATDRLVAGLDHVRTHWIEPGDHDLHVQQPAAVAGILLGAVADGFFR